MKAITQRSFFSARGVEHASQRVDLWEVRINSNPPVPLEMLRKMLLLLERLLCFLVLEAPSFSAIFMKDRCRGMPPFSKIDGLIDNGNLSFRGKPHNVRARETWTHDVSFDEY